MYDNQELTNSHIIRDEISLSLSVTLTIKGFSQHNLFTRAAYDIYEECLVFPRRKEPSRGLREDSVLTFSPFLNPFSAFLVNLN